MTTSRRWARGEPFLLATLALAPLLLLWAFKVQVLPRPYWAHFYDPEMAYLDSGLAIADGRAPSHVDHPGTPVQTLSAAIALLVARPSPATIDRFRTTAYVLALLLTVAGMGLLASCAARRLPALLAIAALWTYFLTPQALERMDVWSPEILFFAFGSGAVVATWRCLEAASLLRAIVAGGALGLCIATKFTFVGWVPALGVALLLSADNPRHGLSRTCVALTACIGAFALFTVPIWVHYPRMFGWIVQLAARSGPYGTGPIELPIAGQVARELTGAALAAKGWLLWTLAIAVAAAVAVGRAGSDTKRRDRALLTFGVSAALLTVLLSIRNPEYRYLLPAGLAILALTPLAGRALARAGVWVHAPVALLTGLLLAKGMVADGEAHARRVAENVEKRRLIGEAVSLDWRQPRSPIVVYSYRAPRESFAARVLANDAGWLEIADSMYPTEGHWAPWLRQPRLPGSAKTCDYLVVDRRDAHEWGPLGNLRSVGTVSEFVILAATWQSSSPGHSDTRCAPVQ